MIKHAFSPRIVVVMTIAALAIYCNDIGCCGRGVTKEHVSCLGKLQMTYLR